MLKNKFKIIALLLVIILAITVPVARAADESDIMPISTDANEAANDSEPTVAEEDTTILAEDPDAGSTAVTSEDNFKREDVYLTGDNVTIDYIVDGNLFVIADSVTINSQIGGDAFICANTITIGQQGYIFSNLFAVAKTVDVQGVVYDVYSLAENTSISGYVYRDMKVMSSTLYIAGTIGRNAIVNCNNLTFAQANSGSEEATTLTSNGTITGNLNYSSPNELSIPEGNVGGNVTYTPSTEAVTNTNVVQEYIVSLGTLIATAIIMWLLCLWLAPKFLKNTNELITKKTLPVIGLGILTPIALIFISIVALVLGITTTVGLLLLVLFFILIGISTSIFLITVNNLVCNKLKIEKTIGIFGMLIATTAVIWAVSLIPYIGAFIKFAAVIIGLGMITTHLCLKPKKIENE